MSRPPNILFITSDQQHPSLLGCLNPEVSTPHLDRLASQGQLGLRAYCPNPTCTPTRASIITGLYPSQHGAYSLGTRLPESVPTLGDHLRGAGYASELIGKAHFQPLASAPGLPSLEAYPTLQDLDFWQGFHGPFYGFDHIELARNHGDEAHAGQHFALWMRERVGDDWRRHFQPPTGTTPAQRGRWTIPADLHLNTWITERSLARLDHHAASDRPFMLWASYFDPHPPYLVPAPWDSLVDPASITVPSATPGEHDRNPPHFRLTQTRSPDFSRWRSDPRGNTCHGLHCHLQDRESLARDIATYYGMMSFLDDAIGRLLAGLESRGLAESTLVVFTSDHGHFYGQHGLIAKGPFHYEDVIRVPFIVRWPGRTTPGTRTTALQSLVDLAPSFLSAAGAGVPDSMAGVDLTPVWRGETAAVRDHVLVENRHQPSTLQAHTRVDSRYKITVYRGESYGEIFDLEDDPGEIRNLWDDPAARDLRQDLLRRLLDAEMGREPRFMPRISGA